MGAQLGGQFAQGLVDNGPDEEKRNESYSDSDQSMPTATLPDLEPNYELPEIVDWKNNRPAEETSTAPIASLPKVDKEPEPVREIKSKEKDVPAEESTYTEEEEMNNLATLPPLENEKENDNEGVAENESKG